MERTNRLPERTFQTGIPADPGVYSITNTITGRVLIGSTANLLVMGNNLKFARTHGITGVLDPRLLDDWRRFGPDAFSFQVLDRMAPADEMSDLDLEAELKLLETMWLEKLAEEALY